MEVVKQDKLELPVALKEKASSVEIQPQETPEASGPSKSCCKLPRFAFWTVF